MQLYYIRHAESANNRLYRETGQATGRSHDPELTETGAQQAERLADFLAHQSAGDPSDPYDTQNRGGFGLTHLYTSLMVRAVSTGTIVASRLGLPLHAWIDWHEEGGLFLEDQASGTRVGQPGYGRTYFIGKYPALVLPESLGDEGWWAGGFEAPGSRSARAHRVLSTLRERHAGAGDRVAVISHGGFYNHFLAAVLGFAAPLPAAHFLNNCGIARFDFRDNDRILVMYQNRVDFLPAGLVTS